MHRRNLTMSKLSLALLAVASIAAACYQDEATIGSPQSVGAMAKVLLTDAPFPFDSVQSVQVYIVSIGLSTHPDTGTSADSMHWVTVASPHRQIDLLTLQQGLTDSLGVGQVTADQYKAVLVTINVDSSAGIRWKNGSQAALRWNGSGLSARLRSMCRTPAPSSSSISAWAEAFPTATGATVRSISSPQFER